MSIDDQDNQIPCCGDGSCCTPAASGGSSRGGKWKTGAFLAVMVLAGAVAAYALFLKDDSKAAVPCCPGGSTTAAGECTPNATGSLSGTQLANGAITIFVLLNAGEELPPTISDVLTRVSDKMAAKGPRPTTVQLYPVDPAFPKTVERYGVTSFPAVIVTAPTGSLALGTDEVSEEPILEFCEKSLAATPACPASPQTQSAAGE